MSEEMIPETVEVSDVAETVDAVGAVEPIEDTDAVESAVNYSEKSLAELVAVFEELVRREDRMTLSKDVEAIKAAFYRKLQKEKADAGLVVPEEVEEVSEAEQESAAAEENPFAEIEKGFKSLYNTYKKERAEYNRQLEKERMDNLALKEAVIADLKALIEKQEDVNSTFPEFREIQNRWRAIGPVPMQNYRNLNDTYHLYVEQFYDMVKINRELRDLDFKKNLEAKEKFCEMAERLSENENVIEAFKELQKLHEQWKEFGPVAKQYRDEIWDRFKAATAVINRKYQAYFEEMKGQYAENLKAKTALCEKVEEIAVKEITDSNGWNACSKEIEAIQKEWKTIGFASRKENQKIYDRFRAACDKFYERKRDFYHLVKDSINSNMEKKISLCEAAEALKTSTEWKKATDQFINLQKQWKEIGAVPRKKSEQLWKRFRAACDEFFNERDKNARPENDFHGNLKAKRAVIAEINAYELTGDSAADHEAMTAFMQRWQEIGFVPFKEKDNIAQTYKEALNAKFPDASKARRTKYAKAPKSDKERLVQKYMRLEQDITTYENNIGFFSMSKNSEPLIRQMQDRIEAAKKELRTIEAEIRAIDAAVDGE